MEKLKSCFERFPRLLTGLAILLLAVAVVLLNRSWSKYYTGSWDGYSELLAVGRATQLEQGWSGDSGLLGIYTEEWGDGEGYAIFKEPPPVSENVYKPYVHQSGLQGTLSGLLARLLRGMEGERRLNALYFANCLLFYGLAAWLCLCLGRRFGIGAGIAAFGAVLCAPWLTTGAKNLYWALWTWLLPCCAGAALCLARRAKGRFCRRWRLAVFAAVLVRCLCGFEYLSTLLILCEIPLVLGWAENRGERKRWFLEMIFVGLSALGGAVVALLCWLGQCACHYGSFARGWQEVIGTALARAGAETLAGDAASEMTAQLSAFGVVRQFMTDGTVVLKAGSVELTLVPLLVLATLALALGGALKKGREIYRRLWLLWVLAFAAPVSWMVLAKGHAAVHTHLTPILWQFALVPVCGALVGWGLEQAVGKFFPVKEKQG